MSETSKTAQWAINNGTELEKRFRVPGVIVKSNCPHCGKECEMNLSRDYIVSPKVGNNDLFFYHDDEATGEDHEWTVKVELIIGVRVIPKRQRKRGTK